jgi:hypothetical protein
MELKNNFFHKVIYSEIIQKIGVIKFKIEENIDFIIYKSLLIDNYYFELIFWKNENRISVNVDDWYEFLDEYYNLDQDIHNTLNYLKTFFSNEVIIEEYSNQKNNIIVKKNIIFYGFINKKKQLLNIQNSIKFYFPWNKIVKTNTIKYEKIL